MKSRKKLQEKINKIVSKCKTIEEAEKKAGADMDKLIKLENEQMNKPYDLTAYIKEEPEWNIKARNETGFKLKEPILGETDVYDIEPFNHMEELAKEALKKIKQPKAKPKAKPEITYTDPLRLEEINTGIMTNELIIKDVDINGLTEDKMKIYNHISRELKALRREYKVLKPDDEMTFTQQDIYDIKEQPNIKHNNIEAITNQQIHFIDHMNKGKEQKEHIEAPPKKQSKNDIFISRFNKIKQATKGQLTDEDIMECLNIPSRSINTIKKRLNI